MLKIISALGTLCLVGGWVAAYRAIPVTATGFTYYFGFAISLAFPALIVGSLLYIVKGYTISSTTLAIHRLFWTTRIPLNGLEHVFCSPAICKGSIRIVGNAGLFSFTGLYYNVSIGKFRLFATDLASAIVMVRSERTIVITPENPQEVIQHIYRLFPAIKNTVIR